jgi:hypothetical protein
VFANVRGAQANAFVTVKGGAGGACEVDVEILDAAGERCGSIQLQEPGPCEAASIGADGTVFTNGGKLDASGLTCAWHWWSGLLR